MALHDWNHDGRNNFADDFIEYEMNKGSTSNSNYTPHGDGISTFGAIVAAIGGLFLAAGILALFGGGEDTPVFLTIIMWIICGTGLGVWFDNTGF